MKISFDQLAEIFGSLKVEYRDEPKDTAYGYSIKEPVFEVSSKKGYHFFFSVDADFEVKKQRQTFDEPATTTVEPIEINVVFKYAFNAEAKEITLKSRIVSALERYARNAIIHY